MNRARVLPVIVVCLTLTNLLCAAQTFPQNLDIAPGPWRQETLTGGFWGLNDQLADRGIEVALSVTQIYQQNVHGGRSTHRRAGRHSGSYDLELFGNFEKLLGIEGGSFYVHAEGVWSKSAGIDEHAVGSYFGVNGDARPRRSIDITELWYEQSFPGSALRIRLGKIDLTGGFEHRGCPVSFDCSMYANDENTQFLNGALINNPTIPFPDYGLAVAVHYAPMQLWYLSAAMADARADLRETGFNTTFHGEDDFFYILETGVIPQISSENGPLQGAYRLGFWYDPQRKEEFSTGRIRRDDTGVYLTCDQMVLKENSDPEDAQGLGLFARYGWAASEVSNVTNFWSAGLQCQGLLPGRDDDVLALGFAQGCFSNRNPDFTDDHESLWELYYRAQLTAWMALSPGIQYVANPGGDGVARDAVVLGVRLHMTF
ncbi:MAG: carbohydrate porin [Planctomycetota bacterium]